VRRRNEEQGVDNEGTGKGRGDEEASMGKEHAMRSKKLTRGWERRMQTIWQDYTK
jgi:hypothetical protein